MAVYERTYKRYEGETTPTWSRFWVLPRYAFADLLKKRFFVVFLVLCFFPPLFFGLAIYAVHNAEVAQAVGIQLEVGASFFRIFLAVQGAFALLLAVFVGPGLISRDLANNGLPLYLSRPFSKAEYVLGKASVLLLLISAVTWLPGLLLWIFQGNMAGGGWLWKNLRIAFGLVAGSAVWMVVLTLLALAVSVLVRWRSVAAFLLLVLYFGGRFFSLLFQVFLRSDWGQLTDLGLSIWRVWSGLFGLDPGGGPPWRVLAQATSQGAGPPLWAGWLSLALLVGLCLLILDRKVQAYEVVR